MDRKRLFILIIILAFFVCGIRSHSVYAAPYLQTEGETETAPEDSGETQDAEEAAPEENGEAQDAEEAPAEAAAEVPEAPVPEHPKGEIPSRAMGFYWAPSENAEKYEIDLKDDNGYEGMLEMNAGDWTCVMGRCILYTIMPDDGNYTWTVKAVNEAGETVSEETQFSVRTRVPEPDAYRPNTVLNNQRSLTFEWEDIESGVSEYRIQVISRDTEEIVLDKWYSSIYDMNHINGICYMPTKEYLADGTYSWRVMGRNDEAASSWSGWTDFEVKCTECDLGTYLNTVSAAIYPNGTITDQEPYYQWMAVTGGAYYQLAVTDSEGNEVLNETVPSSNCTIAACLYEPGMTLPAGNSYVWTVSVYGGNNGFWGSSSASFEIKEPAYSKVAAFIGPENNGTLDPDNPLVIWSDPGSETASFRLAVLEEDGDILFVGDLSREDAWCDGITCSVEFHTIPEGENYQLLLAPYSENNEPGETISLTFSSKP